MNLRDLAEHQAISDAELEPYLDVISPGRNIVSIGHYAEQVAELIAGKDPGGDRLPWPKTHPNFRFLPGEITIWHGINGHGKSAVTTQCALYLALQGRKSCIASMEMAPARTIERMLKQAAGNSKPTEQFFGQFFLAFCASIWLYNKRGRVDRKFLMAAIRYCAAEKQTSHFWIDSLMKCVPGEDDYNGQKDFIEDCCDIAEETQTHVHVIHHERKTDDENKSGNKMTVKGSGSITDLAHNVIGVWRNKRKEAERENAANPAALDEETPDFLLNCSKQRTLAWEGKIALWGDRESWHFREQSRTPWMRGYDLSGLTKVPALEPGWAG